MVTFSDVDDVTIDQNEELGTESSSGALYNLPPGVDDVAQIAHNAPDGFKTFVAVSSADRVVGSFLPAPKFMGSRPGYYFGTGSHGLGYYIDKNGSGSNVSSKANKVLAKKKAPPPGPPPKWALEGHSVAPAAS